MSEQERIFKEKELWKNQNRLVYQILMQSKIFKLFRIEILNEIYEFAYKLNSEQLKFLKNKQLFVKKYKKINNKRRSQVDLDQIDVCDADRVLDMVTKKVRKDNCKNQLLEYQVKKMYLFDGKNTIQISNFHFDQPKKLLNPIGTTYLLRNGDVISEQFVSNNKEIRSLTLYNSIKYVDYIHKNGITKNISIVLDDRQTIQNQIETQYLINRFESLGQQKYKQLATSIQQLESMFQNIGNFQAIIPKGIPTCFLQKNTTIETQKFVDSIFKSYEGKSVKILEFQLLENSLIANLKCVHYSKEFLEDRQWEVDEYYEETMNQKQLIEDTYPYEYDQSFQSFLKSDWMFYFLDIMHTTNTFRQKLGVEKGAMIGKDTDKVFLYNFEKEMALLNSSFFLIQVTQQILGEMEVSNLVQYY